MKKLLIYFLLVLFLVNSAGYSFLFELNRYLVRQEMRSVILRHPSKLISISVDDVRQNAEFRRIDRKEFIYKGIMYDIVRELKNGNKVVFICVQDTRETRLVDNHRRMNQYKLHLALWEHSTMIFHSLNSREQIPLYSETLTYPRVVILLESLMLPTWSPPPECIS